MIHSHNLLTIATIYLINGDTRYLQKNSIRDRS